ncbi:MAG TPA: 2,3-diphosphoglycerate synthetase [Actinomycetota bacterium]|nr:2,3-diphosphoglycerate synthetase [Actinomycetota bacterium]
MRTLAIVDGEHYPPVTRWAIDVARARGHDVVLALLVGGTEKVQPGEVPELGVPVRVTGDDAGSALDGAIRELGPDVVLDLSDEPVLGYRERLALASVALANGVPYVGADFRLEPPERRPPPPGLPTVAVIGTGKRTGKTAIAGEVARLADRRGLSPVVVAMGRGGPPEPEVAEPGSVTLDRLLALVRSGEHAASDYLEDALTTGVATIGARRAAGGLAGATHATNVPDALALAAARRPGLVVLEGSGAAIPPIDWDAGVLVVPATAPPEYVRGYLGPYRLLRSDLAVVTMANSVPDPERLSDLTTHLRSALGDAGCIVTDFHPVPLGDVRGREAFFTTTAPGAVAARQVARLQADHGCRVVGWSARLADRAGLVEDLEGADTYDVLLTELKAAAIDVAAEHAIARGADVVFVDNRADAVAGDTDLDTALGGVLALAHDRALHR